MSSEIQKSELENLIGGWYVRDDEILNPEREVRIVYKNIERHEDYAKVTTKSGKEILIVKNDPKIYNLWKEFSEYHLIISKENKYILRTGGYRLYREEKYRVIKDEKVSSELELQNVYGTNIWLNNGIFYAIIRGNRIWKFDGEKEEVIELDGNIEYWRVLDNGIAYGAITDQKKEDWGFNTFEWKMYALVMFDGKKKLLSNWYNGEYAHLDGERFREELKFTNGVIYAIARRLVMEHGDFIPQEALMRWDGEEENLTDWYDKIDEVKIKNGIAYARALRKDEEGCFEAIFIKMDNEKVESSDELGFGIWKIENGDI